MGALTDDLNKTGKAIAFAKIDPTVSKILTRSCHSCIIAFTDEALAQMLKGNNNCLFGVITEDTNFTYRTSKFRNTE